MTTFSVIQTINLVFFKVVFLQIGPKMEIYNELGESKTFCWQRNMMFCFHYTPLESKKKMMGNK